jgi:gluconolactonase
MRAADGTVLLVDGSLPKPNGITLSPDQSRLYVGSVDGSVYVFPVAVDGSVGEKSLFSRVPEPDGMGVDCAGNLYVTSHGPGEVIVLSPDAQLLSRIQVAPKTTNVAFGGVDRKTLLITAGTGVYSIRSALPGYPY